MSERAADAHRPRSRNGLGLLAVAFLVLSVLMQYAGAMAPQSALAAADCDSFAIFTTDAAGNTNNQNHYDSKPEVFLNGGPTSAGGGLTGGTTLYYQVQEPDGTPLMEIRHITLSSDGTFRVQLYPFETTSNSGNEYKVVVSTQADLGEGGCTKSDNFKVDGPGSLKITKDVEGGPSDFSGDFAITVDCDAAGTFHKTIHFPDPGFVVIDGIDAKARCHVSEGTLPDAPAGFEWGDPTFHDNNAVIESDKTVTVGITNHLNVKPAPALTVDKGVSLSADGPFAATLTTTVGTTVHYRITLTNTGNVALSGVTLMDNRFDLATKCTDPIPTTLAVGAHYDCDYSAVAVEGTTTNVATGDSAETGPDTGTATVVATVQVGSLTITKLIPNVPEGFTGSFGIHVTCTGALTFDRTIAFPTPGSVTIHDIPAGAQCLVIETSRSDPPAGFAWAGSIITGPVTIGADQTSALSVTNLLTELQAGATLAVAKTNNAPLIGGLPTASEGASVTYTLNYTVTGMVHNAVLKDVLPAGVTYTNGSATNGGAFTFVNYDAGTRTLTWTAATASDGTGSVTYMVTVNKGAAALVQPLTNTATIDSDETTPVADTSAVFVAPPPLGETAPPTDIADADVGAQTGVSFPLLLGLLAALVGMIMLVTPAPSFLKGRGRRD